MVKRYRRRRRPRRVYRRRRMMRLKKTSYDGVVYRKCYATYPVSGDAGYAGQRMFVMWNYYDAAQPGPHYNLQDSTEFVNLCDDYSSYQVIGVKLDFVYMQRVNPDIPAIGGANPQQIRDVIMASNVRSGSEYTAAQNHLALKAEFVQKPDYRRLIPGQRIKKYINCGKYFRKEGVGWFDTPAVGGVSGSPTEMTGISFQTLNIGGADLIGQLDVCWYVALKGPRA